MGSQKQRIEVVIGMGANLGEREANLKGALREIAKLQDLEVLAASSVYESQALTVRGSPRQPDFLNAAVRVRTPLMLGELLRELLRIEELMGRVRTEKWAARTIDLDLLWSPHVQLATSTLTVPHPELMHRTFALAPLLEVAPEVPTRYAYELQALGGPPRIVGKLTLTA